MKIIRDPTRREEDHLLRELECKRKKILHEEGESWRICSRVIWIRSGDNNTKFFHKVASHNRNQKHVWEIKDGNGILLTDQGAIRAEAVGYYKHLFEAQSKINITDQIKISSLYPRMVSEEEEGPLYNPVTLEELKSVQLHFKKEKSLNPDEWITKLFTFFFDLVGEDLLDMVEDSRRKGNISGGLNSTFLALILKENKCATFDDFYPIYLCNLCYNVISKVIEN